MIDHLEREIFNRVTANLNQETTDSKAAIMDIRAVTIEIKAVKSGFREEIIIKEEMIVGAAMPDFCRVTTNFNRADV
ncbi:MAG: hypothetical protein M3R14_05825 [Acidobacteriota bacterium]|nr:hypothetical protein [Acidobacteriota bacterium]